MTKPTNPLSKKPLKFQLQQRQLTPAPPIYRYPLNSFFSATPQSWTVAAALTRPTALSTSSRRLDARSSPRPAAWTRASSSSLRPSSAHYRTQVSYTYPTAPGLHHFTWYPKRTVLSGPVVTTDASTTSQLLIGTLYPTFRTCPLDSTTVRSSPNWIW